MSVVVRITELNPVYGVAAEGNVTINKILRINGVRLQRSAVHGKYRVEMPISKMTGKPSVDIPDRDLKEAILEAMVSQYEKRVLSQKYHLDRGESFESTTIEARRSRNFNHDLNRTKSLRSIY